jgi:hypothetical protein
MGKYTDGDFDDFLMDEDILKEVTAGAHKRLLALQLNDAVKLTAEPFIGMWRDREDMQDSNAWGRRLRECEWAV